MKASISRTIQFLQRGAPGRGIVRTVTHYLATTQSDGVTPRTVGNWVTEFPTPTADLPYVWRYTETYYTDGTRETGACERIASYQPGLGDNLLDDTDFLNAEQMNAWEGQSEYAAKSGRESAVSAAVSREKVGVQGGALRYRGHNSYFDVCTAPPVDVHYKDVLRQTLFDAGRGIRRIERGEWYTLSFWARCGASDAGDALTTHLFPSCIDESALASVDGASVRLAKDGSVRWALGKGEWRRHVLTFKTRGDLKESDVQHLLFRLWPQSEGFPPRLWLCMPKLESGRYATAYVSRAVGRIGTSLRFSNWESEHRYYSGRDGELYHDIALWGEKQYDCIQTHTSGQSPPDKDPSHWRAIPTMHSVATDVLFSKETWLENAVVKDLRTNVKGEDRVEIRGAQFESFVRGGEYPGIHIGYRDEKASNGVNRRYSVLEFCDVYTGEVLSYIGPFGFSFMGATQVSNRWESLRMIKLSARSTVGTLLQWCGDWKWSDAAARMRHDNRLDSSAPDYDEQGYCALYHERYALSGGKKVYGLSGSTVPSEWDGLAFDFNPGEVYAKDLEMVGVGRVSECDVTSAYGKVLSKPLEEGMLNGWYCAKQVPSYQGRNSYDGSYTPLYGIKILEYGDGVPIGKRTVICQQNDQASSGRDTDGKPYPEGRALWDASS